VDLTGTDQEVPNHEVMRFLNRLADVLWLLARWEEKTIPVSS
jgi:cob(I)alamin adenosyltransferase